MYLKRLEAFGFKSFADKVVFDFEPGFTCLVGPNGCGKSNVVDSVKWVLGEQSAKSLRGSEMLDVIFNGSAHRKPLNFCEVSLTFANPLNEETKTRALPLDADEVAVSRRLYRSGESEYLINKAQCRLMDIRELLFDTGIGTKSYSIIEQGRIGQLLEANSKERRVLFDEAAGIHKLNERKKVARRKLERTEGNMARLNDTVMEVDRQLKSVTRQAQKARRAKEITDQLRGIKLDLLLHETYTSKNALQEIEGALSGAQDQAAQLSAELAEAQSSTIADQEAMSRLDVEHHQAQQKFSDMRTKFAALDEAIKSERRAAEEMRTEAERARQASREAGARAAALASERERTELDLDNAARTLEERNAAIETLGGELDEERSLYDQTAHNLEEARRKAIDLVGHRSQSEKALHQAESDVSGIDYRIRKARAAATKAEDLLRFAQMESQEVKSRIDQIRKRRDSLEKELTGIHNLQSRTENEKQTLNEHAQDLNNQKEKCRSRRAVLEDLQESGEGLSPGARAVMTTLRTEGTDGGELHGLAADFLQVQSDYRVAINAVEAALGANVEALVVDSSEAVERLAGRLAEGELGRATFLPLDRLNHALHAQTLLHGLDPRARHAPGCVASGPEIVDYEDRYRPIALALLGDVLLFDTLENAQAAHALDGGRTRWRRITLDGDILEPTGARSGGRHRAGRLGPIGRRNEIDRLKVEENELDLKIRALQERIAFLEMRAQRLARDDDRISSNLAALNSTATELKGTLSAIAREESRGAEEKQVAVDEIRELEAERQMHAGRIGKLREEVEHLKREEVAANQKVGELTEVLARQDERVTERRTKLEELKNEASHLSARVEGLERHTQSLSAQFAEKRDESEREAHRAKSLDERREATEQGIAEKDATLQDLSSNIQMLETEVKDKATEKEEARLRFENARGKERALGKQLEETRGQASEIERRQIELRLKLDNRLEEAKREFQISALEELESRGGPPEISDEMRDEAATLEAKLERLGAVNMYALEEQKKLEERLAFLKGQAEDLESARSSLRDVIARINRKSRKQFSETFETVRANFQEIFRKLFGGGKADLVLEEGEDILEAGIEIMARPPGKEPRSILQLSGGEKALTTIALLFAVFRSRPAPFCILDEVDAPLDEANVDRFNHMVREFMDRSQFVVITHNKRTMGYGDMLFGVTMPEPGVSKRIAIKYSEIERHLPMEEIEKQAQEARESSRKQIEAAGGEGRNIRGPFDPVNEDEPAHQTGGE